MDEHNCSIEPIEDFVDLDPNYEGIATIGILIVDWGNRAVRDYIINCIDRLDRKSSKLIDIYVPGYVTELSASEEEKQQHPNSGPRKIAFYLRRTECQYFFDKFAFDDSVEEIEEKLGIKYTYNPMLILVECDVNKCNGKIEYQDKMVIQLDKVGIERVGILFERIFDIAKETVELKMFAKRLRFTAIKGKAIDLLYNAISKGWKGAVKDLYDAIKLYRIESSPLE